MKIKFQIIPKKNLIVHKLTGDFDIDCYTQYSKTLVQCPEWNTVDKMLSDIRGLNTNNVPKSLDLMAKLRREVYKRDYLNVLLVDTPISTAHSHIYKNFLQSDKFRYKYCSTLQHALATLDLDVSEKQAEEQLLNLKHEFVFSEE